MLIRTQDMNAIIDAIHVYRSYESIYGSTGETESRILLGKYSSEGEATQALDALENWLDSGSNAIFRMP